MQDGAKSRGCVTHSATGTISRVELDGKGFLTVLGGILLVLPGFLTDILGLLLLLPPITQHWIRARWLALVEAGSVRAAGLTWSIFRAGPVATAFPTNASAASPMPGRIGEFGVLVAS